MEKKYLWLPFSYLGFMLVVFLQYEVKHCLKEKLFSPIKLVPLLTDQEYTEINTKENIMKTLPCLLMSI